MHQRHEPHTVVGEQHAQYIRDRHVTALLAGELDLQAGRVPHGAEGNTGLHDVKSWHVTAQEHVTGAMLFAPPMQSQPLCSAHVLMCSTC